MKRAYGFTIVELLIVIVVVAILASLSYVGYVNIANRANDSAISSDLSNFAKKVMIHQVYAGSYVAGGSLNSSAGSETGNSTAMPGFKFQPSKSSYFTGSHNLSYCTGPRESSGVTIFRIVARSKSGKVFEYTSDTGLAMIGNFGVSANVSCTGIGYPRTWAYGYYSTNNEWWSWTN